MVTGIFLVSLFIESLSEKYLLTSLNTLITQILRLIHSYKIPCRLIKIWSVFQAIPPVEWATEEKRQLFYLLSLILKWERFL